MKQLPRDEAMRFSMQNHFLQHRHHFFPLFLLALPSQTPWTIRMKRITVFHYKMTQLMLDCSVTVNLILLFLLPSCSRQPQPLESCSRYCPGAGREWQSTRGRCRWGSHCVWELEARTGESTSQCLAAFSPQEEGEERCARICAASAVSGIHIEWLIPLICVDSSELCSEKLRGHCWKLFNHRSH